MTEFERLTDQCISSTEFEKDDINCIVKNEVKSNIGLVKENKSYYSSKSSRSENVENNIRLVWYIVNSMLPQFPLKVREEFAAIGNIGLVKAVDTFDESKGTKFSTYATRCIKNEILMALRHESKQIKTFSFQEIIAVDDGENICTLEEVLGTDIEYLINKIEFKNEVLNVLKLFDILTPRQRYIMINRFELNGEKEKTQRELSIILGISRSYVSREQKRAIKKIRECLGIKPITFKKTMKRRKKSDISK